MKHKRPKLKLLKPFNINYISETCINGKHSIRWIYSNNNEKNKQSSNKDTSIEQWNGAHAKWRAGEREKFVQFYCSINLKYSFRINNNWLIDIRTASRYVVWKRNEVIGKKSKTRKHLKPFFRARQTGQVSWDTISHIDLNWWSLLLFLVKMGRRWNPSF